MPKLPSGQTLAVALLIIFALMAINFEPQFLGFAYLSMVLIYLAYSKMKTEQFPLSKGRLHPYNALGIPLALVAVWLLAASFALSIPINSVIGQLASGATIPITASPLLMGITFIILIPIAETFFFFAVVLPFLKEKLGATSSFTSMSTILTLVIMGILFAFFHLSAHLTVQGALLADVAFGMISAAVVLKNRELLGALVIHIVANGLIIGSQMGWI